MERIEKMCPSQSRAQRRYTAYHEAGHAVIRHQVGMRPFEYIVVHDTATDGRIGEVFVRPSVVYGPNNMANAMLETMAGPIAEAKVRKVSLFTIALTTGAEDYRKVCAMQARLKSINWPGTDHLEITARRLVTEHWNDIISVAEALNQRGHLEYDEFLAITH